MKEIDLDMWTLFWFLFLKVYQPSCVIHCQSYLFRRTTVIRFNQELVGIRRSILFAEVIDVKVNVIE